MRTLQGSQDLTYPVPTLCFSTKTALAPRQDGLRGKERVFWSPCISPLLSACRNTSQPLGKVCVWGCWSLFLPSHPLPRADFLGFSNHVGIGFLLLTHASCLAEAAYPGVCLVSSSSYSSPQMQSSKLASCLHTPSPITSPNLAYPGVVT